MVPGAGPTTGMDANAGGGAPAAAGAPAGAPQGGGPDLNAMIGQVRSASESFNQLLAGLPFLKPQQEKFRKLIQEVITGIAAKAPKQTPSADELP
jgi:hypothetical protein